MYELSANPSTRPEGVPLTTEPTDATKHAARRAARHAPAHIASPGPTSGTEMRTSTRTRRKTAAATTQPAVRPTTKKVAVPDVHPFDSWWNALNRYTETATRLGRAPRTYSEDRMEQRVGRWAATQRTKQVGTAATRLRPDQIEALQAAPHWYWTVQRKDIWSENLLKLKTFVADHGHFPTNTNSDRAEERLAAWVTTVRAVRRGAARGTLTPERVALLESISGWSWHGASPRTSKVVSVPQRRSDPSAEYWQQVRSTQRQARWTEQLAQYRKVAKKLGRAPSRRGDGSDEGKVAIWAGYQREVRRGYRSGSLSDTQIALLEASPFWYWDDPRRTRRAPSGPGQQ